MAVLRKRDQAVTEAGGVGVSRACALSKKLPGLFEFLTVAVYPEGGARVLGTLTIFAEAGGFKACLNDRDQGMVAFVSSDSLVSLLEALEAGLQADTLDWRVAQKPGKKKF